MQIVITKEDGPYQNISFDGGQMIIRRGKQPLQSEIMWLYVSPHHRGKGTAQKALKAFKARLGQKHSLTPVDVLPDAEMFWWKMAARGITGTSFK